ncbi:hypothetical protein [Chryseobacterium sp. HR92]|uniref:hypothetical protein n=1 Tax=Chryseobacterium sp. HR92 TaxID=3094839 RepID=UPI00388DC031|nr:hypothetical protein SFA27_16640 [Chryseobacterium sp. HR92]
MIGIGAVFFLFIEEFQKKKYFIVLGEDDHSYLFATFYVNTTINYNFVENQEVEKLHIVLKKAEYPFLKYDSFLNLSEHFPKTKISLEEEFKKDDKCLVYTLTDEQLHYLRKAFKENPIIKGKIKKKYRFFDN